MRAQRSDWPREKRAAGVIKKWSANSCSCNTTVFILREGGEGGRGGERRRNREGRKGRDETQVRWEGPRHSGSTHMSNMSREVRAGLLSQVQTWML